jgi:hypothetical protein
MAHPVTPPSLGAVEGTFDETDATQSDLQRTREVDVGVGPAIVRRPPKSRSVSRPTVVSFVTR